METTTISINDLISPPYNPRQISKEEMQKLENSITEFGLVSPIVINLKNNHIIGGNQRFNTLLSINQKKGDFYKELTLIKLGDIGLAFIDEDLTVESEDHEKALNLALNKISGEWDFEKLGEILNELTINEFNIDLTGFDELETSFYTDNEEINFNPFDYNDEEEEELPEGYVEVEGERTNESYSVIISFNTQEEAQEFISKVGSDKEIKGNSLALTYDEITI